MSHDFAIKLKDIQTIVERLAKNNDAHVKLSQECEIVTELGSTFSTRTDYTRFSFDSEILKSVAYRRLGVKRASTAIDGKENLQTIAENVSTGKEMIEDVEDTISIASFRTANESGNNEVEENWNTPLQHTLDEPRASNAKRAEDTKNIEEKRLDDAIEKAAVSESTSQKTKGHRRQLSLQGLVAAAADFTKLTDTVISNWTKSQSSQESGHRMQRKSMQLFSSKRETSPEFSLEDDSATLVDEEETKTVITSELQIPSLTPRERFIEAWRCHLNDDYEGVVRLYSEDLNTYDFGDNNACRGLVLSCYARIAHFENLVIAESYIKRSLEKLRALQVQLETSENSPGSPRKKASIMRSSLLSSSDVAAVCRRLWVVLAYVYYFQRQYTACRSILDSLPGNPVPKRRMGQPPVSFENSKRPLFSKPIPSTDHWELTNRIGLFKLQTELRDILNGESPAMQRKEYFESLATGGSEFAASSDWQQNLANIVLGDYSARDCRRAPCTLYRHEDQSLHCQVYNVGRMSLAGILFPQLPDTAQDLLQLIQMENILAGQIGWFQAPTLPESKQSNRQWENERHKYIPSDSRSQSHNYLDICIMMHANLLMQLALFMVRCPEYAVEFKLEPELFIRLSKRLYFKAAKSGTSRSISRTCLSKGNELQKIYGAPGLPDVPSDVERFLARLTYPYGDIRLLVKSYSRATRTGSESEVEREERQFLIDRANKDIQVLRTTLDWYFMMDHDRVLSWTAVEKLVNQTQQTRRRPLI